MKSSLVVQTFEVFVVGNEHVVALVHGCYAPHDFTGSKLTAGQAGGVPNLGTLGGNDFPAITLGHVVTPPNIVRVCARMGDARVE